MRPICPECTRLWLELSNAATTYVKLALAQKGVAARRKRSLSDMTQLREAKKAPKAARVACHPPAALHATKNYRDFPSFLFAAPATSLKSGLSFPKDYRRITPEFGWHGS